MVAGGWIGGTVGGATTCADVASGIRRTNVGGVGFGSRSASIRRISSAPHCEMG